MNFREHFLQCWYFMNCDVSKWLCWVDFYVSKHYEMFDSQCQKLLSFNCNCHTTLSDAYHHVKWVRIAKNIQWKVRTIKKTQWVLRHKSRRNFESFLFLLFYSRSLPQLMSCDKSRWIIACVTTTRERHIYWELHNAHIEKAKEKYILKILSWLNVTWWIYFFIFFFSFRFRADSFGTSSFTICLSHTTAKWINWIDVNMQNFIF